MKKYCDALFVAKLKIRLTGSLQGKTHIFAMSVLTYA